MWSAGPITDDASKRDVSVLDDHEYQLFGDLTTEALDVAHAGTQAADTGESDSVSTPGLGG